MTSMMRLALSTALASGLSFSATGYASAEKVLNVVLDSEITTLDPHFTTANIARAFGFMVYDTLFAMNAAGEIKPQMIDTWTTSEDQLTWTFKLRPGLKWHDGTDVTSADIVASIQRWWTKSNLGGLLQKAAKEITPTSPDSFTITLNQPFGLMLTALGNPNSPAPFMMPKAQADTPASEALQVAVGSGPFVYSRDAHRPGDTLILTRNDAYVPRDEPADFLSGGKKVNIDKLAVRVLPDANTASAALTAGEIDYMQFAPYDMLPILEQDPAVTVLPYSGLNMYQGYLRLNHSQPPFNDPEIRKVLWHIVDQDSVPAALGLTEAYMKPGCRSYFLCDTPYETTEGMIAPEKTSVEAAKAALAKTKYNNEKVVILQATDIDATRVSSAVAYEWLRQVGFNVELKAMDWASVLQNRSAKEGWSMFGVHALGLDLGLPLTHYYIGRNCQDYTGWTCDEETGRLLTAFQNAGTEAELKELAGKISARAHETVPAIMWGQIDQPAVHRKEVSGVIPSAIPVFWSIEKN